MAKKMNDWAKFARAHYMKNKRAGYTFTQALRDASKLYKNTTRSLNNQGPNLAKKAASSLKKTSSRKFLRRLGNLTRGRK